MLWNSTRRSRLELKLDILKAALDEIKPTPLMYKTNTSWGSCKKLLEELVDQGHLLRIDNRRKKDSRSRYTYQTTESGQEFIDIADRLVPLGGDLKTTVDKY